MKWLKSFFEEIANAFKKKSVIIEERAKPELPRPYEPGKIKLGLIVGHEKKSKGASMYGGGNEYDFHSEIARLVEGHTNSHIDVEVIFRDGIGITGAYRKAKDLGCDCVIELHFNAYNGKARGGEVLTTFDNQDIEFSRFVHNHLQELFKNPNRGVKSISRSHRGGTSVHSFDAGPNCLVEPFFGDNPEEAAFAKANKNEYARALINAVLAWANRHETLKKLA